MVMGSELLFTSICLVRMVKFSKAKEPARGHTRTTYVRILVVETRDMVALLEKLLKPQG